MRTEGFRHIGVKRGIRRQFVNEACIGDQFAAGLLGIDDEGTALAGINVVILVTQAADRDPLIIKMQRVLHIDRGGGKLLRLVAIDRPYRRADRQAIINRIVDVEIGGIRASQHVGAQGIAVIIGRTKQQVVAQPADFSLACQIRPNSVIVDRRILRRIGPTRHLPGAGIIAHHARLIVRIFVAAIGVV
ncbi:hypothetical protein D3C87_1470910 [compost metagenome]